VALSSDLTWDMVYILQVLPLLQYKDSLKTRSGIQVGAVQVVLCGNWDGPGASGR